MVQTRSDTLEIDVFAISLINSLSNIDARISELCEIPDQSSRIFYWVHTRNQILSTLREVSAGIRNQTLKATVYSLIALATKDAETICAPKEKL